MASVALTMFTVVHYEATLGSDAIRSARLLSREVAFGLEPIFHLTARLFLASEK